MASRMLRDWTTSEKIDQLSEMAELFFVRLIMKADDHGCFHANPKLLKAALFPLKDYSEKQMDMCLNELQGNGIVSVYEHEGRKYLKIKDFGQRMRTMVSKFPQPADNCQQPADIKPPELEGKRREGEVEVEVEEEEKHAQIVRNFEWFKSQIDEIWTDQLPSEKKINLGAAIQNAWEYLSADTLRLKTIDSAGCKQLVSKAFQYVKNGHIAQKKKSFDLKDI